MTTGRTTLTKIVILVMAATAFSACHRDKADYQCTCRVRATDSPFAYDFGEIQKEDAYARCARYNDTADSCGMIVIK